VYISEKRRDIMRMKEALLILLAVFALSCGVASDAGISGNCLPEQDMTIINSSEYEINHLYVHDSLDYFNDSAKVEIGTNMVTDESVTLPVSYGDTYYFTFVRNIFSSSSIEIAITTESPVRINECYTYTLHLLEDEFYIETTDNFE
jgi:hypothetical protein